MKFPIRLEGLAYAHGHFSSVSTPDLLTRSRKISYCVKFSEMMVSLPKLDDCVMLKGCDELLSG